MYGFIKYESKNMLLFPFISYLRSHLCTHLPCFSKGSVVAFFFPFHILVYYVANKLHECEKNQVCCGIYHSRACIIPKQMTWVSKYITDKAEHPAGLGVFTETHKIELGEIGFLRACERKCVSGFGNRECSLFFIFFFFKSNSCSGAAISPGPEHDPVKQLASSADRY